MKIKKLAVLCMATLMLGGNGVMSAQAAESSIELMDIQEGDQEQVVTLEDGNSSQATVYGIERGSIISTAVVSLENLTGGKMEITISTLAHVECDRIQNIAFLYEQQEDGSWKEIKRYEYNAYKKDFPTEDLSGLSNVITVEGLKVGNYYRLKGIHCVWADGKGQAFSSKTDAVLATKYGD